MISDFDSFINSFDYNRDLSLYLHIPFCISKCLYCAFYSLAGSSPLTIHQYVKTLLNQIEKVTEHMEKPFYTVYIGGGNPGCIDIKDLDALCTAICKNGKPQEFSIEMNPENLSENYFFLFSTFIDRLSVGIQSFNEKALLFLGRNSSLEKTLCAVHLATKLQQMKKILINFDLITCLPAFFNPLEDLSKLFDLCLPENLSVYSLTLENKTPLSKMIKSKKCSYTLPDSDRQADILYQIWSFLENKNYEHYEVSNFAKKAKKSLICKHNSVYWSYGQYMGLGTSACSRSFKNNQIMSYKFVENDLSISKIKAEKLKKIQGLEEFVIMGLRQKKGLDLIRLEKDFNASMHIPDIKEKIFNLVNSNYYTIKNNFLVPGEKAFMISDYMAKKLLF